MVFFTMFSLIFILIFGMIVFTIVNGITQWNKNNHSPRLTVDAVVVAKRTQVLYQHHNVGENAVHMMPSTSYYVTFEVESGDRIEFDISGREYGMLAEGDKGRLSFQGTRYLDFERI